MMINPAFVALSLVLLSLLCNAIRTDSAKTKVLVTGAAGRTGSLLVQKLLQASDRFEVTALVREVKSGKKLYKKLDPSLKNADVAKAITLTVADVADQAALELACQGMDKVVLCTSAVPKISVRSIIKVLVLKLFRKTARPTFTFPKGRDPYNVDWLGAKNQIDAAKKAGVKQFVFLGSMGGTQPDNFLNSIGKVEGIEESGNILLWKRKAEEYLIQSGMSYTIVHPGGLLDKPGGEREIVFGVDDNLLKEQVRSIPREDVAEVLLQSLHDPKAINRSFDIISKEGLAPTKNWDAFFSNSGNCKY